MYFILLDLPNVICNYSSFSENSREKKPQKIFVLRGVIYILIELMETLTLIKIRQKKIVALLLAKFSGNLKQFTQNIAF